MKLLALSTEATESSLLHPLSGEPLEPLITKGGRVVWPILGGAQNDDDDDDDSDDDDDDDDSDDDDDDDSDDSTDKSKSKSKSDPKDKGEPTPEQKRISELTQEKIRMRKQRNQERQEKADLQSRLEKLENKDKPELDQVTKERDEHKAARETAEALVRRQAVDIAFFSIDEYSWKNPADALELARGKLKDVDVEDGVADSDAVKEIVKELAESKTYLLNDPKDKGKTKETEDKDSKGNPQNDTGSGGTGGRGSRKTKTDEALRKKYPALRR